MHLKEPRARRLKIISNGTENCFERVVFSPRAFFEMQSLPPRNAKLCRSVESFPIVLVLFFRFHLFGERLRRQLKDPTRSKGLLERIHKGLRGVHYVQGPVRAIQFAARAVSKMDDDDEDEIENRTSFMKLALEILCRTARWLGDGRFNQFFFRPPVFSPFSPSLAETGRPLNGRRFFLLLNRRIGNGCAAP